MENTLLKQSLGMYVEYSDGGYSGNMRGRNFTFQVLGGQACLTIDMSGNLRVKNKAASQYEDAGEFVEQHIKVKHIQILDADLVRRFFQLAKSSPLVKNPEPTACMILMHFGGNTFLYNVTHVELRNDSAMFDVQFRGTTRQPSPEERKRVAAQF